MCKTSWFLYHNLLFLNVTSPSFQPSLSVDGPLPSTSGHKSLAFHHAEAEGESSQEPNAPHGSSRCPGTPTASISSRRLSSPQKIIHLHEQLQKTLKSSSHTVCTKDFSPLVKRLQTPENTGRGQEPRKYHSFSAPADLIMTPQRKKESQSFSASHTKSVPLSAADAFHSADLFTGRHLNTNNSEFHTQSAEVQLTALECTDSTDSPPETTASDTAAPLSNYLGTPCQSYGAATERGRPLFAASYTPQKSFKSERESSVAVKKSRMKRLKPGNTYNIPESYVKDECDLPPLVLPLNAVFL